MPFPEPSILGFALSFLSTLAFVVFCQYKAYKQHIRTELKYGIGERVPYRISLGALLGQIAGVILMGLMNWVGFFLILILFLVLLFVFNIERTVIELPIPEQISEKSESK